MKTCVNCGNRVGADVQRCGVCGAYVPDLGPDAPVVYGEWQERRPARRPTRRDLVVLAITGGIPAIAGMAIFSTEGPFWLGAAAYAVAAIPIARFLRRYGTR